MRARASLDSMSQALFAPTTLVLQAMAPTEYVRLDSHSSDEGEDAVWFIHDCAPADDGTDALQDVGEALFIQRQASDFWYLRIDVLNIAGGPATVFESQGSADDVARQALSYLRTAGYVTCQT